MKGQLWVEVVGDLIIARVRGEPTEALIRECQEKVLFLVQEAGRGNVLYDALEMDPPPIDVPWAQMKLNEQLGPVRLRQACVVPNTKIAYLARLAFGAGDYKVFYNDMVGAVNWLSGNQPAQLTRVK
ncbi:MAG TPA: hypothetical protein VM074_07830 [Solimonas sp.]|nr:hypothetical protein [Solimonas sp.]